MDAQEAYDVIFEETRANIAKENMDKERMLDEFTEVVIIAATNESMIEQLENQKYMWAASAAALVAVLSLIFN